MNTPVRGVFRLVCFWTKETVVDIEADSLDEAIAYAIGPMPVPEQGRYVDGSFQVDRAAEEDGITGDPLGELFGDERDEALRALDEGRDHDWKAKAG